LKPLYKIDANLALEKDLWVYVYYFGASMNNKNYTKQLSCNQSYGNNFEFKENTFYSFKSGSSNTNNIDRFYSVNSYGSTPVIGNYVYTLTAGYSYHCKS
jgi:hypothetical protein